MHIYPSRHAHLPGRYTDNCILRQIDRCAFISVYKPVRMCEYSLGRTSHNFNKLDVRVDWDSIHVAARGPSTAETGGPNTGSE